MAKGKSPQIPESVPEEKRKIIMWMGVAFCMLLVSLIWIMNTKSVVSGLKEQQPDNVEEDFLASFDSITGELRSKMEEVGNAYEKEAFISELQNKLKEKSVNESPASAETWSDIPVEESIAATTSKDVVEDDRNQATTTATTTDESIKNIN